MLERQVVLDSSVCYGAKGSTTQIEKKSLSRKKLYMKTNYACKGT